MERLPTAHDADKQQRVWAHTRLGHVRMVLYFQIAQDVLQYQGWATPVAPYLIPTDITVVDLKKGQFYRYIGDDTKLKYIGKNWSGNGYWHQFYGAREDGVVWSVLSDADLHMIEEWKDE